VSGADDSGSDADAATARVRLGGDLGERGSMFMFMFVDFKIKQYYFLF
jgi:hypothetical protein